MEILFLVLSIPSTSNSVSSVVPGSVPSTSNSVSSVVSGSVPSTSHSVSSVVSGSVPSTSIVLQLRMLDQLCPLLVL